MAARRRRAREADGFPRGSGIVRRVGIGLGAQAAALVRVDAEVRVRLQRCGALECQPPLTCSHHHADRLIAALEEAQSAGGDIRGRQSAALVVVAAGEELLDRGCDDRPPEAVALLVSLLVDPMELAEVPAEQPVQPRDAASRSVFPRSLF